MSNAGLPPGGPTAKSNMDVPNRKDQDLRTPNDTDQASDIPVESLPDSTGETFTILKEHIDAVEAMVAAFCVDEVAKLAMSLNADLDAALGQDGTKE